mmetsp:Transcript_48682/g.128623  ORF Transcript_48682/g.128623 Transcript_48682/m.128623 type:complete len:233 (-) Transcript_48682:642-1340(-)
MTWRNWAMSVGWRSFLWPNLTYASQPLLSWHSGRTPYLLTVHCHSSVLPSTNVTWKASLGSSLMFPKLPRPMKCVWSMPSGQWKSWFARAPKALYPKSGQSFMRTRPSNHFIGDTPAMAAISFPSGTPVKVGMSSPSLGSLDANKVRIDVEAPSSAPFSSSRVKQSNHLAAGILPVLMWASWREFTRLVIELTAAYTPTSAVMSTWAASVRKPPTRSTAASSGAAPPPFSEP